jgi:hypothetical protein
LATTRYHQYEPTHLFPENIETSAQQQSERKKASKQEGNQTNIQ